MAKKNGGRKPMTAVQVRKDSGELQTLVSLKDHKRAANNVEVTEMASSKEITSKAIVAAIGLLAKRVENGEVDVEDAQAEVDSIRAQLGVVQAAITAASGALIKAKEDELAALRAKYGHSAPSTRAKRGRRWSGEAIKAGRALAEQVTAHLKKEKTKMGRSALATVLGVEAGDLGAALKLAKEEGWIKQEGEKRGAVYAAN